MPVRWHDQEAKTQGGAKARSNWTFSEGPKCGGRGFGALSMALGEP